MPVVQITALEPVRYSLNGFTMTEFAPGELYEVPPYAMRGMVERNWAKALTEAELEAAVAQQQAEAKPEPPEPTNDIDNRNDEPAERRGRQRKG